MLHENNMVFKCVAYLKEMAKNLRLSDLLTPVIIVLQYKINVKLSTDEKSSVFAEYNVQYLEKKAGTDLLKRINSISGSSV